MDLLENEEQTQKNKKFKVIMIIIAIIIVLLIGLCALLLVQISDIQQNTLKLTIDGASISKFSDDLFLFEDNEVYIAIKDFATLVGYEPYNGDRSHIEEDMTKCYIDNGREQAAFELNSEMIYKTLAETEQDNEYFNIDKPVKMKNDKLYVTLKGMQIGANCAISYDEQNHQIIVYTLPFLVQYYGNMYENAAITEEDANYSNQKAILYGMVVVVNENEKYGVNSTEGDEIIGTKYESIKFIENSQNFIIKTDQGKMGIVTSKGTTRIEANYDEIKQIDHDLNLYLATNNKKQGILNENGNTVVYLEYDKIGIDADKYPSNNIKNQYLLFNKCIPVQRDNKWGIFDVSGKQILPVEYDELGCIRSSGSNSLLIIPEYEAIVVKSQDKYGLVNARGETLIPFVLDAVYSITDAGKDSYYMTQMENKFDVVAWLKSRGYEPVIEEEYNNSLQENQNSTNTTDEGTENQVPSNTTNGEETQTSANVTSSGNANTTQGNGTQENSAQGNGTQGNGAQENSTQENSTPNETQ